jgi:hypothetical protein
MRFVCDGLLGSGEIKLAFWVLTFVFFVGSWQLKIVASRRAWAA